MRVGNRAASPIYDIFRGGRLITKSFGWLLRIMLLNRIMQYRVSDSELRYQRRRKPRHCAAIY